MGFVTVHTRPFLRPCQDYTANFPKEVARGFVWVLGLGFFWEWDHTLWCSVAIPGSVFRYWGSDWPAVCEGRSLVASLQRAPKSEPPLPAELPSNGAGLWEPLVRVSAGRCGVKKTH